MKRLVEALLRRRLAAGPRPAEGVDIDPEPAALYAVGDVHGCLGLYRRIETEIRADATARGFLGRAVIVLLGDVIDRGPDSAAMIDHLLAAPPEGLARICLLGNHEDMMLRFIENPAANRTWLDHGGVQTLASYGIGPDPRQGFAIPARRMRQIIEAHVPAEHLEFLRGLPAFARTGRHFLAHAGGDPSRPLAGQGRSEMIWPRLIADPEALPPADLAGRIIVHGHVPVSAPRLDTWRINVDTGAYATGILSGVHLSADAPPRLFSVSLAARRRT